MYHGEMSTTYINVKEPPYNAAGDGITDDYAAIIAALNDAAGRTVYFPVGTYLVGASVVPSSAVHIVGDDKEASVIKAAANISGYTISLPSNSSISSLTVDANLSAHSEPVPVLYGVNVAGNGVRIVNARVRNVPYIGIVVGNVVGTEIRDSEVDNTGSYNIWVNRSPKTIISGCKTSRTGQSNILMLNSPNCLVENNVLGPSGPVGSGIYPTDCDRLVISGNLITRGRGGIEAWSTIGRMLTQYGIVISNNVITKNYNGGISISSSGATITGNNISENGGGGINGGNLTMETGIKIDPSAFGNSAYRRGDILTLQGGEGPAAKVFVVLIPTGGTVGSLYYTPATDVALYPMDMGNYSTFPPIPIGTIGGHGSGANVIYTNSKIAAGGSGYQVGDVLRVAGGMSTQPARVIVTSIGGGGAVTGFKVIDGGGYSSVPFNPVTFVPDMVQAIGTEFKATVAWGKRYSNYTWTFGLQSVGPIVGASICANIISDTRQGPAIVLYDQPGSLNGRMNYSAIVGNIFRNNPYSIKGKTGTKPFNDILPAKNKIDLNIGYRRARHKSSRQRRRSA
jgi:parallel beta-helix repeat protein